MRSILNFFVVSIILFSACSSDEDKAKEYAEKFCEISKIANTQEKIQKLDELKNNFINQKIESNDFSKIFIQNLNCLQSIEQSIDITDNIQGNLSSNLMLIPDRYKIVYNNGVFVLKFKIKLTNQYYNTFDWIGGDITLLDNSKYPIEKYTLYRNNGSEKVVRSTFSENIIDWVEVDILRIDDDAPDVFIKLVEGYKKLLKAKYFSVYLSAKSSNGEDISSSAPTEIVSASDYGGEVDNSYNTSDCSSLLSEYESFVDDYISFVKKAANGDYSAMANATELMTKAENIGRKIQNMGEVQAGSSCWSKYIRLQTKLTNAAMNLTKNLPKSF